MKKFIHLTLAAALLLTSGACSSSKTTEGGDNTDQQVAEGDAATDAVPQAAVENGANPSLDAAAAPSAQVANGAEAASPSPSASHAVAPSVAGSGQFQDYTVQAGDSLMKIAFETYGDLYRWKSILEANKDKVTDPNRIPAGTVLKVEAPSSAVMIEKNGEKYLIKSGDTLGKISGEVYGTASKWRAIWENNKQLIHDPNRIFAGFYLYYRADGNMPTDPSNPTSPSPLAETPVPAAEVQRTTAAEAPTAAATPAEATPAPAAEAPASP